MPKAPANLTVPMYSADWYVSIQDTLAVLTKRLRMIFMLAGFLSLCACSSSMLKQSLLQTEAVIWLGSRREA